MRAIPSPSNSGDQLSPGTVPSPSFGRVIPSTVELGAPESAAASVMPLQHAPGADVSTQLSPGTVAPRGRVEPLAPERYALQTTIRKDTRDKLRRIQELLGHQIAPSETLRKSLTAPSISLLANLEKQKFAATSRPRPVSKRESKNPRHIPAHVKRSVWERDQGQCSYVSDKGHRCPGTFATRVRSCGSRRVWGRKPPSRPSGSAAGRDNQYVAECVFGAEFMKTKRGEARVEEGQASSPTLMADRTPTREARRAPGLGLGAPARKALAPVRAPGGTPSRLVVACGNSSPHARDPLNREK